MNILKYYKEEQQKNIESYQFPLDFTKVDPKKEIKKIGDDPLFPDFSLEEVDAPSSLTETEELPEEIPLEETVSPEEEILEEAKLEAKRLVEEAQKNAEEILSNAQAEAEQLKMDALEQGRKDGHELGYQEGYEDGQKALEEKMHAEGISFLDQLDFMMSEIEEKKKEILQLYKEDLKNIAVSVGEKVIHISLKSSGEVIEKMIISSAEKLDKRQWAKIYLSKIDVDLMMRGDRDMLSALSHLSDQLKIIVMEKEASGTCIIELPDKIIDASADTQIENIKGILNNAGI